MRLLQFFEAIEEKFEKPVIWDNGRFFIAVNNPDKPTFFTAWTQDNEKIGVLATKVLYKKGEPWMAVDYVDVVGGYQQQGIAKALYHVMVQGMSPEYGGLFGYGPDIASKHVSKIYRRMGAHEQDDGHFYVPNPNRAVTEAIDPTQLVNVDTSAFRAWFGNSKAVDDQGHPIVFFRGTAKRPRPDKFSTKRSLPSFVASADIASIYAASYKKSMLGTPFGQEPAEPTYQPGATVSPVFLSIQNPVDMRGRESMNMEMDIFGLLNSDWSNWEAMQLMLDILGELGRAEERGVRFEHELPDLPGSINVADWREVIEWLEENWEVADNEQWGGHAAEMFTSVLAGIEIDSYAVADAPTFNEWAAAKGFDGVVHDDIFDQGMQYSKSLLGKDVPNGLDEEDMHTTWRPFEATQVKSIFNQGGWSPESGSGMHEAEGHPDYEAEGPFHDHELPGEYDAPAYQYKSTAQKMNISGGGGFSLLLRGENIVEINQISSEREGGGTAMMDMLTELADKMNIILTLRPEPYDTGSGRSMPLQTLRGWYVKYGFERTGHHNQMARLPNSSGDEWHPTDEY